MTNKMFICLLISFAIIFITCSANYSKYYIEDYCLDSKIAPYLQFPNDSALNTSIILYSSRIGSKISNKTCAVRIVMSKTVYGLIVNPKNVSLNNTLSKKCEDYIRFGSSSVMKWCNTTDAQSLIISDSTIDIEFNAKQYSYSNFELVITPFKNPISERYCMSSAPFRCEKSDHLQCISNTFKCDGYLNCPNGNDEHNCSNVVNNITDTQEFELGSISINDNFANNTSESDSTVKQIQYNTYNILNHCEPGFGHEIEMKFDVIEGVLPAILYLSNNLTNISNKTCAVRFTVPKSHWYSNNGLVLGIDKISIKGNSSITCDDFIEVNGTQGLKWCENNITDAFGMSFSKSGKIDINFKAGEDSKSEFSLIITPFQDPLGLKCFDQFKCSDINSSSYECINKNFQCDQHINCPNGEDEVGCTTEPPTPTTPTTTITTPKTTTTSTPKTTTTSTPKTTTTSTPKTTTAIPKTTTAIPKTTTAIPKTTTAIPKTTTSPTNVTTTAPITTTTNSTSTTPCPPSPLKPGYIVLIVLGSIAIVSLICGVIYIYLKRRQNISYSSLNN